MTTRTGDLGALLLAVVSGAAHTADMTTGAYAASRVSTEAERMHVAALGASRPRRMVMEARVYCEACSGVVGVVSEDQGPLEMRAQLQQAMREHAETCPGRDR